jgi:hypothetical protein
VTTRALLQPDRFGHSIVHTALRSVADPQRRLALTATILLAGSGHLLVGAQHSPSTFGTLALLSGVAQLGLAAVLMLRPSARAESCAVVASLVLIQLYVLNVTVGLPPLIAHTHVSGTHEILGLRLAWPAPIEGIGIVTQVAQLGSVAFGSLRGRSAR